MATRREFLKYMAATGIAMKVNPTSIISKKYSSKVAKVNLKKLSLIKDEKIIKNKIYESICKITEKENITEALKTMFSKGDRVGIKLNPTSPPAFSRPEILNIVLKMLNLAGIQNKDIIIWDRFESDLVKAGFRKSLFSPEIRILSTEPNLIFDKEITYVTDKDIDIEREKKFGNDSLISSIMTNMIDKCINIGAAKDHISAGVTLCLKSMSFGVMNNTKRFHAYPVNCDPAIGDVYSIDSIKNKTVLSIIDSIYTIYNGGTNYYSQWCEKSDLIFISKDPVAIDRVVAEHIDSIRYNQGFRKIMKTRKPYKHIFSAEKLGLGTADLSKIKIINI